MQGKSGRTNAELSIAHFKHKLPQMWSDGKNSSWQKNDLFEFIHFDCKSSICDTQSTLNNCMKLCGVYS